MKKNTLLLATLLVTCVAVAQKKNRGTDGSSNVKYTLISDSEDFNFIGGGANINVGGNAFNFNIGFDLGLDAHFGKLDLTLKYFRQTSGMLADLNTNSDEGFSIYENSATNSLDARAAFVIKSTTENKDIRVVVKSEGNSQVRTLYYIPVPAREKISYMAELGLNKGITFYKAYGTEFKGKAEGSSTVEDLTPPGLSTNMSYTLVNFGGSRVKAGRAQINTADYGEREEVYYSKLYARISILVKHQFDDVLLPTYGDDIYFRYNIQDYTDVSKAGFNIGYYMYTPNKLRTYYFAEAGIFPGPKTTIKNKAYLNFGFGITLAKLLN